VTYVERTLIDALNDLVELQRLAVFRALELGETLLIHAGSGGGRDY